MSKFILVSTAAAMTLGGALLGSAAPAQAQVGVEFGPGGVRLGIQDDRPYRPVIERRERRVIVDENDEEECRIVVRRRTNQFGEVVTRRTRVCD
ncbi:hypothetical protein [Salinarimonas soli]|uniref:Uncharacterized protein n=1 Tax=Salinarimonas soli TaxID=1638099 RepID=A0A5B2V9H2_9HYPH|nr:hypothetical protein [Salinarimonas soli]KAA2236153.1 hypothetical protein F0L46_15685 [Salinarimonas soli]